LSGTRDERQPAATADALLGRGRWGEAVSAYRETLESRPGQADAWFNLGYALRRLGQFEESLAAYGQAIRQGVTEPEVAHLNRAAILSDHLRRDAEAFSELRAALTLAPDFGAALLNLGNLHEEKGELSAAFECYHRILSRHTPADRLAVEALARLLHLEPPVGLDDALLARAQREAEGNTDLDDSARATLLFSIGRALDSMQETEMAFRAFTAANRFAHRGHEPDDCEHDSHYVRELASASLAADVQARAIERSPAPLFICGMFRSGSTLLEQVLASHPSVATAGELDLLPRMVAGPLAPFPASMAGIDEARWNVLADAYHAGLISRLPCCGSGKRYATDKRPDNYLLIGLVKRLFPGAKILHSVRDPVDNGLSIFMQHLNPRRFGYAGSLEGIGRHYGEYRRLMAHWKSMYPDDIFDFDYDAFVADPRHVLGSLLEFLDLPWEEGCLEFHLLANTVKTASYWEVRRPLYTGASGRWRRYRDHLGPLLESLDQHGVLARGSVRRQTSAEPR
jgi:tetratricopeptide (TPR) repeat protein